MIKHITKCRICGNPHLAPVVNLGEMHVQGAFKTLNASMPPMRKIPNEIVRCDNSKFEGACGAVQARHTISPEILYRSYHYASGVSQTMRDHLKGIVDELRALNPNARKVLDIACNDGTLLRNYPESFERWGVDPSDIAGKQTDLKIINECFPTSKLPPNKFDIITTIACFYDVDNPLEFVKHVRDNLDDNGVWCCEVAYWPAMLSQLAYDQILAEHILHYSLHSLETVCKSAGLKIFRAEETATNGGSIMIFATPETNISYDNEEYADNLKNLRFKEFEAALDDPRTYENFVRRVEKNKADIRRLLFDIRDEGKTIAVLGASTKLNTVLGYCNIGKETIKYAIERSPDKVGGETLSGIKMISEGAAKEIFFDYYLIGPYHFKQELLERERDYLERGGKMIFALPELEVWDKNGLVKMDSDFDLARRIKDIAIKTVSNEIRKGGI